jgi:dTDP-4-amino-4,6-dideoxygalactose transaminase
MTTLAIKGGTPLRRTPFPAYVTIGEEEKKAVMEVLDSKVLSDFLGVWSPKFFGGPRVQRLEKEWSAYFRVKHAVSVNSATSGLNAAVGAAGVGPGDEVIVSPYTMSASATAALVYGGIPVFADISPDTFCLDPASVRQCVTPRTRAIIAVDLFGHPAEMNEIMAVAREHDLVVIEDAAQAPGARYHGRHAGTLAHIGVFSLNYHKTIHCGEGGVVVTDSDALAERVRLIRNHAEAVVDAKGTQDLVNMIGFNYRMTEIEAAIASEQLKKLESLLAPRIAAAEFLTRRLGRLPGLTPPVTRAGARHGFYVYALRHDASQTGVSREQLAAALAAEGLPISQGYVRPIYLQPAYQQRMGFGRDGFPFNLADPKTLLRYKHGACPVTERMHERELLLTNICHAGVTEQDLEDFCAGFEKVFAGLRELA